MSIQLRSLRRSEFDSWVTLLSKDKGLHVRTVPLQRKTPIQKTTLSNLLQNKGVKMVTMKEIEEFAKSLCDQDAEDPDLYSGHVQLTRKYAVELASIEKADAEVCEIAALLHDIGKCEGRENHHVVGRDLAEKFLEHVEMPEEKKKLILKCILKHRSRFSSEDNEIEVKVVQSADCLGTIFNSRWQEHCRKTYPRKVLLDFYDRKALEKINLDSARTIAEPQLKKLRELVYTS